MDDGVWCRIDAWNYGKPGDYTRQRECCYVRGVDRNRMRKMAHPAVLIFRRLAVPVCRGLQAERQNSNGDENAQQPQCSPAGSVHP